MNTVAEILQQHHLKSTKLRTAVLDLIINTEKSFSNQDFAHSINFDYDRVTLFRVLNTFEEAGIIHKIIDNSGNAQYAYSKRDQHHAHFICNKCATIYCLDLNIPINGITIPEGFEVAETDIKINGTCAHCLLKIKNN